MNNQIGKKIRDARISKGLTQEELGKIIGVQKAAIGKYENGVVVNIKRSTLKKLAEVLDLRGSDLIGEPEEMQELQKVNKESFINWIESEATMEDLSEIFEVISKRFRK